ncbi:YveK family protein [Youngiibacter multivorans]|uniref:Capsular polysaccharide biosynthesis protein n=1 Tax=Youngiibacter multivorans TaxID=937251 RepID=A0ABS4G253_9CLOT|nr:Wzz/FepE/Etk N-terminal domain-containing protein [Youngiibacter multivorans]MBP1918619.1 capsular polysaccharide biosynthesis protein [Youngiibacter multivorans]
MEDEMTLDLRDLFNMIRKRKKLIIIITIICTLASGVISFFILRPVYEAQTSIIVGKPQGTEQTVYSDIVMYQNLVKTYVQIAKSKIVADETATRLGEGYTPKDVQDAITVTPQSDTQIMVIKARNEDPSVSVQIATAAAGAFIDTSKTVFPTGGNIQIMDRAQIPTNPVSPNKKLNIAIAFLIGLMGSMGVVFVIEYLDNTIKSEDDIARYLDLPVIGIIPKEVEDNGNKRRKNDRRPQSRTSRA